MSSDEALPTGGGRLLTRDEVREMIVGCLAVAAFALVLLLSYFGTESGGGSDGYRVIAGFNRIDGLNVGDEVQVGGVPVGRVEAMTLGAGYRAMVTLSVADGVALPADTSAAIHTDGLFGSKFVVLDPGGEERLLGDGGRITYTQDSLIVGELLDLIIAEGRAQRAGAAAGAPAGH